MEIDEVRDFTEYTFGWIKDDYDPRDKFKVSRIDEVNLPTHVDMRESCPPVYDQGPLGSCVLNAIGGAFEFDIIKQGNEIFMPSRLFAYYNARKEDGTIKEDSGTMVRTGMKVVNKYGICHETTWPYIVTRFKDKPSRIAYNEALGHQSIEYSKVNQWLPELKSCLAEGYPFVFGIQVYNSFMSKEVAMTGNVPMPGIDEPNLGGHAILGVGFDNSIECFIVRNSWGLSWGDKGYFYLPYKYISNSLLASDFWTLKRVEG